MLLTQNVTTVVPKASEAFVIPGERGIVSVLPGACVGLGASVWPSASVWQGVSARPGVSARLGEVGVGTIQCESWSTWTLAYQISILRANRRIYREARSIFYLENFWIVVWVNKAGFGEEIKNRGFPVATVVDVWRSIRFPVMKVTVIFPSLESQKQSDALLVAAVHFDELIRTLWTTKGSSEMEVTIQIQQRRTNNSPGSGDLLRPFLNLRSIKRVTILGVSKQQYIDELTRSITITDGINSTMRQLLAGTKCLQRYIDEELWEDAIAQAKEQIILIADCKLVYGKRFLEIEPGLSINTAIVRSQSAKEMIIATAVGIAAVTLYLRQYENAVRFADRALDLILLASVGQPGVLPINLFTLPPHHPFPTFTGTVTFDGHTTGLALKIRARACMGMRQLEQASRDLEKARNMMPEGPTLSSSLEILQVRSGKVPSALPPPIPFQFCALADNFARAADAMGFDW